MIKQFYGVTLHQKSEHVSIYEATLTNDTVVVKKIRENHTQGNKIDIGKVLKNGDVLGIMANHRGFVMYDHGSGSHRPDGVNTRLWGGNTSPLVGLFINQDDAIQCLKSPELTYWDERFLDRSVETIKEISETEGATTKIRLDASIIHALANERLRGYLEAVRTSE